MPSRALLAAVLYRVDARHRKIGLENLRLAFGDRYTEAERDQIVRGVYRHFCMMLMEILHIPRKLHPTTWRERITLVGEDLAVDRLLKGGPIIMLSGHFGNWEMAGYLFGVFGFPPHSVARALDNPYLDRFLRRFRERSGQRMIPKKGGYDQMLAVLRDGGVLSFLADQDAGERGMFVEFFGRPASTHKAIALLALEHRRRWSSATRGASGRASATRWAAKRSSSPTSGPARPTTPGCSPSATRRPSNRSSAATPSNTSGSTGAGSTSRSRRRDPPRRRGP